MADRDFHGFLRALAAYVAGITSLKWEPAEGELRQLAIHSLADDETIDDPATFIRLGVGAPKQFDPMERFGVQFVTRGTTTSAALTQAHLVYNTLSDEHGRPIRHVDLDAHWRIVQCDPAVPQPIGRDENNRHLFSFNATMVVGLLPEA